MSSRGFDARVLVEDRREMFDGELYTFHAPRGYILTEIFGLAQLSVAGFNLLSIRRIGDEVQQVWATEDYTTELTANVPAKHVLVSSVPNWTWHFN